MKRRNKLLVFAAAALVTGAAVFQATSRPSYRLENVHPALRAIKPPFQSVDVSYYLDGGSIEVVVTNQTGNRTTFALPVQNSEGIERYSRLFIGEFYLRIPLEKTVALDVDTRDFIINLLDRFAKDGPDKRVSLVYLRNHPKDHLLVYWPYPKEIRDKLR